MFVIISTVASFEWIYFICQLTGEVVQRVDGSCIEETVGNSADHCWCNRQWT